MTLRLSLLLLAACAISGAQIPTSGSGLSGQSGTDSSLCDRSNMGNCSQSGIGNGNQQEDENDLSNMNPMMSASQLARHYSRMLTGSTTGQPSANGESGRPIPPITTKSDFQIYAEEAAGHTLKVYGRDIFDQGTSTFTPLDHVPVPADYVVGPEDELHVEAWGKIDADVTVTVDRNGQVFIPRVGSISVAGLRYDQLEGYVRAAVGKIYKDFDLSVTLGKLRTIQVYVLGSARQPGSYTVGALSTLIDALFASGGPSATGSMRSIELRREGKVVTTIDLYDVIRRGDKTHDAHLLQGDVIYIAPVGPQVAVIGNVNEPGIYELKNDLSVAAALESASGPSVMASSDRVVLERIANRKALQVEELSLDTLGLHRKLRDGDLLRLAPISPEFADTVMLRGSVAVPGRYPWREGMRVGDLIPSRTVLITRDHWIQLNHLIEFQENRIAEKQQSALIQAQLDNQSTSNAAIATAAQGVAPPASADQQAVMPQMGQAAMSQMGMNGGLPTGIDPNNPVAPSLSALYGTPGTSQATAQAGTVVQQGQQGQQQGQTGQTGASANNGNTTAEGQAEPQTYRPLDLISDLSLTDAEINWDYAVIERLDKQDLTTRLISFNLGEAIANPTSESNQALEPGDVVTIFSRRDIALPTEKHSAFVKIEGEVGAPGVYRVDPGETLRNVMKRAGGLTKYSYIYATELTRASTRKLQQEELVSSIQRLRKEMSEAYANSYQTTAGGTGAVGTAAEAQAAGDKQMFDMQQNLLDHLLTQQASGRIVLGIRPSATSLDDVPNFPLDDGDTILVPARLDTVQIMGEVYNENALRYQPGRRLSAYLSDTGGFMRTADSSRMYLIRADGTVIDRKMHNRHWSGKFDNIVLMPGDAVVVPPKVRLPGGFMEELPLITQILSQSALTGAVLKILM